MAVHNVVGYTPATQEWFTIGEGDYIGVTTNGFSGFGTTAYALAVVNNGLYIGGTFNRGGGLLTPNLARWDLGNGVWSSPGAPAADRDAGVYTLAGTSRMLLVGGTFSSISDVSAHSAAVLDTTTGAWNTLDDGLPWNNGTARVKAATISAAMLYVGGEMNHAGPHPAVGFARYGGDFSAGPAPDPTMKYQLYVPLITR